jgi:hypothetical protein
LRDVAVAAESPRWRSLGALCREFDWSQPRLLYELQNGLPYRTFPPGHVIDWYHPDVERGLDLNTGRVTYTRGVLGLGFDRPTVGVEVLPPTDTLPLPPPVPAPSSSNVSAAALERCFREIMAERPDDPPDEEWLLTELKRRLDASPKRQRVRDLWRRIAPQWKRPRGHPRNKKSAE